MMGAESEKTTFVCGCVRFAHVGHAIKTVDEVDLEIEPHSTSIYYNSKENQWMVTSDDPWIKWLAISATVCEHPQCQMVAIGAWGNVLVDGKGDFHEELIHDFKKVGPDRCGKLLRVRGIGKRAYAVGMGRMVYRRDDVNKWTAIDKGVLVPGDVIELLGFDGIDGFSEEDIYAGGLQGEIWHYNGKKWTQLDSPTNVPLYDIICGGDGQVYAAGRDGVLVQGRGDNWRVLTDDAFQRDIWNLCWFADRLFIATTSGLFYLNEKGKIKPVDFGADVPNTTYHLSARDGIMWSIGAKDIMQYDGKTWTRID
jgi:hypothetical protein